MLFEIVYCLLEKAENESQDLKQVKDNITIKLPPKRKVGELNTVPQTDEKCKY